MYGQKQIFQCLVVVVLIAVVNFYRTAIRRDKEIQKNLKLKREHQEKTVPYQWSQSQCDSGECKTLNEPAQLNEQPANGMFKNPDNNEFCDISKNDCRRSEPNELNAQPENDSGGNSETKAIDGEIEKAKVKIDERPPQRARDSPMATTATIAGKMKINKRTISKTKINGSTIETTGVLTYIAVTILLVSLIKAAVDVSKHIREKRQRNNMDDNELLRRCSLQEYAMVKQQQQQLQQQSNNGKRKSVSKLTELMPQSSVDSGCNNPKLKEQTRRMSTNPQDYLNGSGIITEPGSPVKPGKLLAGRPAPLLRRCSVPAFGKSNSKLAPRRPSMDSVSEDDNSSPDVKRRVRMINRH